MNDYTAVSQGETPLLFPLRDGNIPLPPNHYRGFFFPFIFRIVKTWRAHIEMYSLLSFVRLLAPFVFLSLHILIIDEYQWAGGRVGGTYVLCCLVTTATMFASRVFGDEANPPLIVSRALCTPGKGGWLMPLASRMDDLLLVNTYVRTYLSTSSCLSSRVYACICIDGHVAKPPSSQVQRTANARRERRW